MHEFVNLLTLKCSTGPPVGDISKAIMGTRSQGRGEVRAYLYQPLLLPALDGLQPVHGVVGSSGHPVSTCSPGQGHFWELLSFFTLWEQEKPFLHCMVTLPSQQMRSRLLPGASPGRESQGAPKLFFKKFLFEDSVSPGPVAPSHCPLI